jgi:hypothetical protein
VRGRDKIAAGERLALLRCAAQRRWRRRLNVRFGHVRRQPKAWIDMVHAMCQQTHARLDGVQPVCCCFELAREQVELSRDARASLRQQGKFRGDGFQLGTTRIAPARACHHGARG